MILTDKFKVVAVSDNTNSFGLHQCVMVAKSGIGYKACANYLNIPQKGDILDIPVLFDTKGNPTESYDFSSKGFEIPIKIEKAPEEIIREIWG